MVDVERPTFLLQIRLHFTIAFYKFFQNITILSLIDDILRRFANRNVLMPVFRYHRDAAILTTLFDYDSTVRRKKRITVGYSLITFLITK